MLLPRLYAILDAAYFGKADRMFAAAEELAGAGVTLLQYRNKTCSARQMLDEARELKRLVGSRVHLIMNDRADLCVAADFDGLHVGQDDLSPEAARRVIGESPSAAKAASGEALDTAELKRCGIQNQNISAGCEDWPLPGTIVGAVSRARWLGVSTHNQEQLGLADRTSADYLAIGPVFATSSKLNPDPVVGLEGVRRARALTRKPLVAIGGITRANARAVIEAGADAVAVISDLIREPRKSAEEFLRILG